jgi:hypothetical protein
MYIFNQLYFIVARKHADDDPFSNATLELTDDFHETLHVSYAKSSVFFFKSVQYGGLELLNLGFLNYVR